MVRTQETVFGIHFWDIVVSTLQSKITHISCALDDQ